MNKRKFVKYENRKVYDLDEGHYIDMDELDKVATAGPIEVVDDVTKEDLTAFVLARLIYDRCRRDRNAFSNEELYALLRRRQPAKAA